MQVLRINSELQISICKYLFGFCQSEGNLYYFEKLKGILQDLLTWLALNFRNFLILT